MMCKWKDDLMNNVGKGSRSLKWGTTVILAWRDYRQQQQQQQIWIAGVLTEIWTGHHLSQFSWQEADVGGTIILKINIGLTGCESVDWIELVKANTYRNLLQNW